MSESLDDLLDRSAPAVSDRGPGRDAALAQMVRDARDTERPRRGRRRVALLSGLATVLLVGTAGIATAASDWLWIRGLENPDRSYTYVSPTWGECEIRVSHFDMTNPVVEAEVNRIVDEWFADTDVEAAAAPHVAKYLTQLESDQKSASDPITDPRLPDLNAWTAHEQALGEAIHDELESHGFGGDDARFTWSSNFSQVHCENEDWGADD
ncbi:hypothetical protein DY023_12805 [Microbacterium bovistercoris]|uniref:Uncharacterized protein n=1 Tax=Microbacterium bovistercoris TaxID=2293570 RepID=A0A371NRK0_9MICO|nr:hypothetical protein [Microbacterium bovistercoris]REJ04788.1 hypothetical protein DY023_12805 [Microbacterium bovistercoris]